MLIPRRGVFLTTLAGYPLSLRSDWKFLVFSSNVALKEFFLRSLNNSPKIKPFVTHGGDTNMKVLHRFIMRLHVKDRFFVG